MKNSNLSFNPSKLYSIISILTFIMIFLIVFSGLVLQITKGIENSGLINVADDSDFGFFSSNKNFIKLIHKFLFSFFGLFSLFSLILSAIVLKKSKNLETVFALIIDVLGLIICSYMLFKMVLTTSVIGERLHYREIPVALGFICFFKLFLLRERNPYQTDELIKVEKWSWKALLGVIFLISFPCFMLMVLEYSFVIYPRTEIWSFAFFLILPGISAVFGLFLGIAVIIIAYIFKVILYLSKRLGSERAGHLAIAIFCGVALMSVLSIPIHSTHFFLGALKAIGIKRPVQTSLMLLMLCLIIMTYKNLETFRSTLQSSFLNLPVHKFLFVVFSSLLFPPLFVFFYLIKKEGRLYKNRDMYLPLLTGAIISLPLILLFIYSYNYISDFVSTRRAMFSAYILIILSIFCMNLFIVWPWIEEWKKVFGKRSIQILFTGIFLILMIISPIVDKKNPENNYIFHTDSIMCKTIYWMAVTMTDIDRDGYSFAFGIRDPDDFSFSITPFSIAPKGLESFTYHDEDNFFPNPLTEKFKKHPPHIFIIVADALRPENKKIFGYKRDTTPNIDGFARENILFTKAYSQSNSTICSIRHLMSGRYSTRLIYETPKPVESLPLSLAKLGYKSFIFHIGQEHHEIFRHREFLKIVKDKNLKTIEIDKGYDTKTVVKLFKHIDNLDMSQPAFVYVHFRGGHIPWVYQENGTYYGDSLQDQYDNAISACDSYFGNLISELKKRKLYDDSIIIFTSDHGHFLGERGAYGYVENLFETNMRVPLIMKIPGVKNMVIPRVTALIDIAPTLCHLLNDKDEYKYHGCTLVPLFLGREMTKRENLFFIESFADSYGLLSQGRWKLIVHRGQGFFCMFDLKNDPKERENIIMKEYPTFERLKEILQAFIYKGTDDYSTSKSVK